MRTLIRKTIRKLYKALQYTPFIQSIEEEFEIQSYSGITSRHYEYPFGIGETVALSKKKKISNILDAGSFGSPFGLILAELGFNVVGVDIIPWEIKFPRFTQVLGDLKDLSFEDNTFDLVTSISTMEHCGLPRFSEKVDKAGDIKGMRELYRVIKPGGYCILTVPYAGKGGIYQNKHRVYDPKTFMKLIGKFKIVKQKFFAPVEDSRMFQPCSKEEIESLVSQRGSHGVICIVGRKSAR